MEVGVLTMIVWIGVVGAMLAALKFWLGRICSLTCEDLACVDREDCEPGEG